MNINEATRILRGAGYYCYKNRLGNPNFLTEASAIGMLKKIPEVLKGFKERLNSGEKEEVKEDLESLKDEIQSKNVLSGFGNASMLKKSIFGAIAALALACNANAAMPTTNIDDAFDRMENTIETVCGNAESCVVNTMGDRVVSGDGDGVNTFTWKLSDEKEGKTGDHFYKINIDQDNNGKADMSVILHIASDGHVQHVKWLENDYNDGKWEKANDKITKIFPNVDKLIQAD